MEISQLKEKFDKVIKEKEALQSKKIELTTTKAICESEIEKLNKILKEEYNINSIEEAEVLLNSSKKEVEDILDKCESELNKYQD